MINSLIKEILWYAVSIILMALGRSASSRAYRANG